jgi:hypothetical protein
MRAAAPATVTARCAWAASARGQSTRAVMAASAPRAASASGSVAWCPCRDPARAAPAPMSAASPPSLRLQPACFPVAARSALRDAWLVRAPDSMGPRAPPTRSARACVATGPAETGSGLTAHPVRATPTAASCSAAPPVAASSVRRENRVAATPTATTRWIRGSCSVASAVAPAAASTALRAIPASWTSIVATRLPEHGARAVSAALGSWANGATATRTA